jgi:hypothetical protein
MIDGQPSTPRHFLLSAAGRMFSRSAVSCKSGFGINRLFVSQPAPTLRLRRLHIADNGLRTVVQVDVLDANVLITAVPKASKNFHLHRIRLH